LSRCLGNKNARLEDHLRSSQNALPRLNRPPANLSEFSQPHCVS
jgi:hypothetical protein